MSQQEVTDAPMALYRLYGAGDDLLYVGITGNLRVRFARHAAEKQWWPDVARRTVEWLPSWGEALKAEAAAIRAENPRYNIVRPQPDGMRKQSGDRHREKPISLRFGEDRQAMEELAARNGLTLPALVVKAVHEKLERLDRERQRRPV